MSENPPEDPHLSATSAPRRRRTCCRCCCCCLIFLLLFIFLVTLVLAALIGIFYLWYKPAVPDFHLQSLATKELTVVPKPGSFLLSSNVTVRFQATNKNKKLELRYGDVRCRVTVAGGIRIGEGRAPGFTQEDGNITVLDFDTATESIVVDADVGRGIEKGMATNTLAFVVELRTAVGVRIGKTKTKKLPVKVGCPLPQ